MIFVNLLHQFKSQIDLGLYSANTAQMPYYT